MRMIVSGELKIDFIPDSVSTRVGQFFDLHTIKYPIEFTSNLADNLFIETNQRLLNKSKNDLEQIIKEFILNSEPN